MTETALALRIAAVLFWVTGLGISLFTLPVLRYLARRGELPRVFGMPAFDPTSPLGRFPPDRIAPLLLALVSVGLLETAAGAWVWLGDLRGAILGLALLPASLILWVGFYLPFPPLIALARTLLVLASWDAFRP